RREGARRLALRRGDGEGNAFFFTLGGGGDGDGDGGDGPAPRHEEARADGPRGGEGFQPHRYGPRRGLGGHIDLGAEGGRDFGDDVDVAHALAEDRVGGAEDGGHGEDDRVHLVVVQRHGDGDGRRVLRKADELLVVDDERALRHGTGQPV